MEPKKPLNVWLIKMVATTFFLLLQIFLFFGKKYDCLDLDVYPNNRPTYFICGPHSVGQTFLAPCPNLNRIDIMMGTYGRQPQETLFFYLWEISGQRKILRRQVKFLASTVKNNLYQPIRFNPLRDSKGKVFYFALSSPEATEETGLSAWMNERNIYRHGNYIFDGRPSRGDLVFRTYSRNNLISALWRVTRRYSSILGNKYIFYAVVASFEILSLSLLLFLFKW